MATKHYVITPDGKRHTRTSKNRVYSHVTVMSPPKAGPLATIARENEATQNDYAAKYRKVLEAADAGVPIESKTERIGASYTYSRFTLAGEDVSGWIVEGWGENKHLVDDPHEVIAKRYREFVEHAVEAAEHYAQQAAEYEAMDPDTEVGAWSVVGWSSRADLSRQVARGGHVNAHAAKRGQSIHIMEAQIA